MYFEHAPLFGGFIISLQHPFHWQIRVIIYIENVPLLGDSGSSYMLIKHVTCTLISRFGFIIYQKNTPPHLAIATHHVDSGSSSFGDSGSSCALNTPPYLADSSYLYNTPPRWQIRVILTWRFRFIIHCK